MSRRDNRSFPLRGVPRELLEQIAAAARRQNTTKNAIVLAAIRDYAAGAIAPRAAPPTFDPNRQKAAPYGPETSEIAVSGIPIDTFAAFMARAKREGWHSKNALIVALLDRSVEG
jgi:hypothetical protein